MIKGEIITELFLREIDKKGKIFFNDTYRFLVFLLRRGYLKDERFTKEEISGAFYNAVRKKYIKVIRRLFLVEISLTKKGKRRLERYNQGIYVRELIKSLKIQEQLNSFTGF